MHHPPSVVRSRLSRDLGGLTLARVRHGVVYLGSRRTSHLGGPTDASLAGSRRGGVLGRLRREAARSWDLWVLLLLRERRLLRGRWRRGRRGPLEAGRRWWHLVLRGLLLRGRRWGSKAGLPASAIHDSPENVAPRTDRGRLLRGARMLRRAAHGPRWSSTSTVGDLAAKETDLFLVPFCAG